MEKESIILGAANLRLIDEVKNLKAIITENEKDPSNFKERYYELVDSYCKLKGDFLAEKRKSTALMLRCGDSGGI